MSVNSVGIDTLDLAIICEHTGQPHESDLRHARARRGSTRPEG